LNEGGQLRAHSCPHFNSTLQIERENKEINKRRKMQKKNGTCPRKRRQNKIGELIGNMLGYAVVVVEHT
jgi:hypothetical protein